MRRIYVLLGLTLLGVVCAYFAALSGFVEHTRSERDFALHNQQMRAALDALDRLSLVSHLEAVHGPSGAVGLPQDLVGELALQSRAMMEAQRAAVRSLASADEFAGTTFLVDRLDRDSAAFEARRDSVAALERVLLTTEQLRQMGARALELRSEGRASSALENSRWVTGLLLMLLAGTMWAGALIIRSSRNTLRGLGEAMLQRDEQATALQRERDFATGLLDTAPVIVLLLSLDGRIRYTNPYFERLSGYRLDEVRDQDWLSMFVPEREREQVRALFETATQGVPTRGHVNPIVTRDGELQVEWYDQLLRGTDGTTTLLAIGQDVSERVRVAAALDEFAMRLKEAQRIAQVGSWELDLADNVLTWSDEVFRIFEIDTGRFGASYEAFLDLVHPDERTAVDRAYAHSLKTRTPYSVTHRLLMPDGRTKHVHERCETTFDTDGTPRRSVGTIQDVTELRRAEAARERAETTLRAIFDQSAEGMLLIDAETGRFQASNRAIRRMLDYDAAELGQLGLADIYPTGQRQQAEQVAAISRGEVESLRAQPTLRRGGRVFYADATITRVSFAGGHYLLGLFRDVTAAREAEQALAIQDAAIASSINAIAMAGMDGTLTYVNRAFLDLWGLEHAEQAHGQQASAFWNHPTGDEAVVATLMRDGHWRGEALAWRADGTTVEVQVFENVVMDKRGRPMRLMASFVDLTERRRTEEALLVTQAAVDSSINAIAMADLDGRITYANPAFLGLWRLERPEQAVGHIYREFVPASDSIVEVLLREGRWQGDARGQRSDGALMDLHLSANLVTDKDGRPLCMMASFLDITERKHSENTVRELNDELERRVTERTAQLASMNKELETFTYSVSHDLKAPLRGIDGYTRLLLEDYPDRLDETGRQFLYNVRSATVQMSDLIDDLLVYSRMESRDASAGLVDLRQLIDGLLAERADDLRRRGATVSVALSTTSVIADRDGLAIALRNLVENALKFTRAGVPAVIEIGGRDDGQACVLWVRDNGMGFDMKFHERIFTIFQRLHRAEDFPGTGVGLAIVRKAMDRMQGRVWAESKPGQGATFYLEIAR